MLIYSKQVGATVFIRIQACIDVWTELDKMLISVKHGSKQVSGTNDAILYTNTCMWIWEIFHLYWGIFVWQSWNNKTWSLNVKCLEHPGSRFSTWPPLNCPLWETSTLSQVLSHGPCENKDTFASTLHYITSFHLRYTPGYEKRISLLSWRCDQ